MFKIATILRAEQLEMTIVSHHVAPFSNHESAGFVQIFYQFCSTPRTKLVKDLDKSGRLMVGEWGYMMRDNRHVAPFSNHESAGFVQNFYQFCSTPRTF